MGRPLKTDIPQPQMVFTPKEPHLFGFWEKDKEWKEGQKCDYGKQHRVKNLTPLPDDQPVWVQTGDRQVAGRVTQPAATHI